MRIRTVLFIIWSIYTNNWMICQYIWGGVEPNIIIAITEIVLCIAFIALGIERLINLREK